MGNASGSMIYAAAGLLILYFAGMIVFKIIDTVSRWYKNKFKKEL